MKFQKILSVVPCTRGTQIWNLALCYILFTWVGWVVSSSMGVSYGEMPKFQKIFSVAPYTRGIHFKIGLVSLSIHEGWLSHMFFNGRFLQGNEEILENFILSAQYALDTDFKLSLVLYSIYVGWLNCIFFNGCFLRGNDEIPTI